MNNNDFCSGEQMSFFNNDCPESAEGTLVRPRDLLVGDRIFASDNEFGIPTLITDGMPQSSVKLPVSVWGHNGRGRTIPNTLLFYLSDTAFKGLVTNPQKILLSGASEVAELNLTVNDMTPPAVALNRIYDKRWVSRYLQENGVKVWVDLNVSRRHACTNLLGVPQGYNAFATRGYADRIDDLDFELGKAQEISGQEYPNMIVYGGGCKAEVFCFKHKLIYVPDYMTERRKIITKKKGGK